MRFHMLLFLAGVGVLPLFSDWVHAQEGTTPADASAIVEMSEKLPATADAAEQKFANGDMAGAAAEFEKAIELSSKLAKAYPKEPVYSELTSHYSDRLGTVYFEQGDYARAAKTQEASAEGYAAIAAKEGTPENKKKAADALGTLAWYHLAKQDPASAVASARKGLAIDPTATWVKTNLAHGLLLSGQIDEAMAIYRAEKNQSVTEGRTFQQAVLGDLEELEKLGIRNPQFNAVRELYGATTAEGQKNASQAVRPTQGVGKIVAGVVVVMAAFIAFLCFAGARRNRKRAEAMTAVCSSLGYTPRATTSEDLAVVANTQLAARKRDCAVSNVIDAGDGIGLFDFSYTTGSGDTEGVSIQTVIRVESTQFDVPAFVMTPSSIFTKIAEAFGFQDIDFSTHPEFSGKYLLRGADEAGIRAIFTPSELEYFEKHRGLSVEGSGHRLLVYRDGNQAAPEEFESFVTQGREIAALFVGTRGTIPPPIPATGASNA